MKNIAIIICSTPHGVSKGREALDIALSLSDINHISLFFIADGVFHLLPNQHPDMILMRNYIATLKLLSLYDIDDIYVCQNSLSARNILASQLNIEIKSISPANLNQLLEKQDSIFNF